MNEVVLRWYCGHYVGPCRWHGTDAYEPDECGTEFDTREDPEEVENEDASATCPKCGAELNMRDDEPHIINGGQDG